MRGTRAPKCQTQQKAQSKCMLKGWKKEKEKWRKSNFFKLLHGLELFLLNEEKTGMTLYFN